MNEIQRFAIPALLALLLHGILANFTLHEQPLLIPKQKGMPISVRIDAAPPDLSPDALPAPEQEEITAEPAQPDVTAEQLKPEPALPEAIVERIEPEPLQPEAIAEPAKAEPIQPEALGEQIRQPSIPAIKPVQRKRIVTPVATRQNPVAQKTVAIKEREQEPLSESEKSVEPHQAAGKHTVIDDRAAERRPGEEKAAVVTDQKAIPAYRHNEQPHYPVMAKRRGYQGEVVLHVLVDSRGSVSEIEIKATSGHSILDRTALATVKRWQFFPATIGGKPVAMWVDVPIDFRLR